MQYYNFIKDNLVPIVRGDIYSQGLSIYDTMHVKPDVCIGHVIN